MPYSSWHKHLIGLPSWLVVIDEGLPDILKFVMKFSLLLPFPMMSRTSGYFENVFVFQLYITIKDYSNTLIKSTYTFLTRPQLMEMPSLALSPVAPVRFSLSDPAKSTKWNLADNVSNSDRLLSDGLFSVFSITSPFSPFSSLSSSTVCCGDSIECMINLMCKFKGWKQKC